jgi:Holliday junction DNA helicase RuvA
VISRIGGVLAARELDRAEIMTPGGVAYEVLIPLSTFEALPRVGQPVELRTLQVVREDAVLLFGFLQAVERTVFARLLAAPGVGPKLALAIVSALSAEGTVRAVRDRNVAALTSVGGVGKKTAERLVLDLAGKMDDIPFAPGGVGTAPSAEDAIRALSVLGFNPGDAERAVRAVIGEQGSLPTQELIRAALARVR